MAGDYEIEQEARDLATVQIQEERMHNNSGGVMGLIEQCLLSEEDGTKESFAVICGGRVDHFQQVESFDELWGCGWRNIQILSSNLIEKEEMKDVVFGGACFVPCILALQKWLELGWRRGFDVRGAQQFGWNMSGSCKWIGSTECAALFRSFGLRANIVEFKCHEMHGGQRHKVLVDWIWRYFLCGCNDSQLDSDSAGHEPKNRVLISNKP